MKQTLKLWWNTSSDETQSVIKIKMWQNSNSDNSKFYKKNVTKLKIKTQIKKRKSNCKKSQIVTKV